MYRAILTNEKQKELEFLKLQEKEAIKHKNEPYRLRCVELIKKMEAQNVQPK